MISQLLSVLILIKSILIHFSYNVFFKLNSGTVSISGYEHAKIKNNNWTVFSHGGTKDTGINALNWILKLQKLGAGEILLTSMDKDGTKSGFDLELLKSATNILDIPVIASGGVGELRHFRDGVIIGKANALLAASVFHFGEFSISEVKKYLKKENIEVRL